MLKAVENPSNGEIGQGVMVTPDGGYVVAQPDLYVHFHPPQLLLTPLQVIMAEEDSSAEDPHLQRHPRKNPY